MSEKRPGISTLVEKIGILTTIRLLFQIGSAALLRLLHAPFRGVNDPPTLRKDIQYTVVRQVLGGVNPSQIQALSLTTERVYEKQAKKHQWTANTIDLGSGAKGHWLGPPDAETVLIFFHGGGYIGWATPGHLLYQFALQKAINQAGHNLSIFSASYSLAPSSSYPTQLKQAVEILRYLTETKNRDPSTILIGGDSAGGNLASALLLHLAVPKPGVPELKLSSPLKGAVLISPWVDFNFSRDSYERCRYSDYLARETLIKTSPVFLGGHASDSWAEPASAPAEMWESVANIVQDVFIWGGGGEVLIDGIRVLAKNMKAGFESAGKTGKVVYVETPRAAHELQIIKYTLRDASQEQENWSIENWIKARL